MTHVTCRLVSLATRACVSVSVTAWADALSIWRIGRNFLITTKLRPVSSALSMPAHLGMSKRSSSRLRLRSCPNTALHRLTIPAYPNFYTLIHDLLFLPISTIESGVSWRVVTHSPIRAWLVHAWVHTPSQAWTTQIRMALRILLLSVSTTVMN